MLCEHKEFSGVDSNPWFHIRNAPEEDCEYTVERILDSAKRGKTLWYKVLWKGYPEDEATWEPAVNLHHLTKILHEYNKHTGGRGIAIDSKNNRKTGPRSRNNNKNQQKTKT